MLNFESDYIHGAHEKVLNRLIDTNMEPLSGYGNDKYSESAKQKIKDFCCSQNAQIFFLSGGTQTNQVVIDSMLKGYEAVICADTGHINSHEAGAIEYSGHKVITLKNNQGKIAADDLLSYLRNFYLDENYEHTAIPGMVYISHPTEFGTLYTYDELKGISDICKTYDIPLYMDGARLGYALVAPSTNVTIKDIYSLCDAFYIGGTKVGALCGEAVVFTNDNAPKHFFTSIKQHGALLAKGRLVSVQFDTLFTDDLYLNISRHAIRMADIVRKALKEKGYEIYIETTTNQIFVVLDNEKYEQLKKSVSFSFWERLGDSKTVVRIATSWATTQYEVDELVKIL